jgi:hypothetical protein
MEHAVIHTDTQFPVREMREEREKDKQRVTTPEIHQHKNK